MEVEIDAGSRAIEVLIAMVVLGAVAYIVVRSVNARRRGEDVGQAAAGALREVGPPVLLAVVGLIALSVLAALAGIVLIVALISALGGIVLIVALISALGGDGDQAGGLLLLWLGGIGVLLVGVVAAVGWGLVRIVRRRGGN